MFEKSLYDLIRGLRNHKGNEKEYIQNSLKECRAEIRGQDMDLKATALLKLVYLEMFGHDMSWASFHVLEVMSSAKYLQKRVGYLGAVQSFRPDTEVLMLATNLLKKDLTSTSVTTMTLPIITLPHVITPSLAMSVLSDLLPRLTHSHPAIRKKTIVTLYRLALVYPETLRPAWPKIKERLMDESEDSSVTAAIVNVVCELGWRRPSDFLPLAPRLFELLVDSGNNWMAIKLIKLFATLTPLEPRLVRKLLPPLTSIIRTTPAMSLLYECINGIIQGGILDSGDDSVGGEEIATLCVTKLRGMIMVEGDANLKYVALLAFNKIVLTHPYLVAQQEDVIMECIDSPDISIRLRALDLVVGMVNSDNLMSIVGRLMRQLKNSRSATAEELNHRPAPIEPSADSDDESPEAAIKNAKGASDAPLLPDDYKVDVITRILEMCSGSNYGNLVDFDWYIDILTQLVRTAPIPDATSSTSNPEPGQNDLKVDVSEKIGDELRNVAVKVKAVRLQAARAAETILVSTYNDSSSNLTSGSGILRPIAWIAGEYASYLASPEGTLTALLQLTKGATPPESLIFYLQALPKIFSMMAGDEQLAWTPERKTMISLLMARVIHALEPLAIHPDLEVQERAVEFSELLKLAAEAATGQEPSQDDAQDAPLLLTQAIPSLFIGLELNSVAVGAQKNVPIPSNLDLNQPINANLSNLLKAVEFSGFDAVDEDEFEIYYHKPEAQSQSVAEPATNRLGAAEEPVHSYQQGGEESYLDPDIVARRRAERLERNKDDPFYIPPSDRSGGSTPLHNILQSNNGTDMDIDAIPIMQLDLGKTAANKAGQPSTKRPSASKARQRIQVAADETLATSGTSTPRNDDSENSLEGHQRPKAKGKHSLLQVDSSHIGAFSLEGDGSSEPIDYERQQREEAEMAKAMKEVERLRLEMQRASERIEAAKGVEGTVVKKKKKKPKVVEHEGEEDGSVAVVKKKKKSKKSVIDDGSLDPEAAADVVKPKKKKKKKAKIDEGIVDPEGVVDS
ncbi:Adaptor protein complex AP-3 delta subunit [Mollisia scopiformis]|uniref:AP-3 complex subunit delta n=1 Tax=Mollisia scopiformis TaxID=149040 RepID=A0A194X5W9_MOLSC|nr:Adaptor protein complex AP-3 delta subunit [Mollisia scopiformis]KUJ15578.1 Adaptor protein complex AP-3 delta subunit [Mollisia scopiformis]